MTWNRRKYGKDSVGPEALSISRRHHRYCYDNFSKDVIASLAGVGYGDPSGTVQTKNLLHTGFHSFPYQQLTASGDATIVAPVLTTDGRLNIGSDQTLGHGVEIVFGDVAGSRCPRIYTPSTENFFARLKITPSDASGVDIYFGLRVVQAFQAAIATYTDLVALRILGDSTSAAAAMSAVTNLNDATDVTSTTLATTLADATAMELGFRVKNRVVDFFVDRVRQVSVPTFTFDSGDVVTPFLWFTNATDLDAEISPDVFECGLLADIDKTFNVALS